MSKKPIESINVFLCGDVMIGRGIDQILSHPVNPEIYEPYVTDARDYVRLAESMNGPIPRGVSGDYLWGDALFELRHQSPHLSLINLETSVTSHDTPWPYKGINYRMHPKNIDALTTPQIDVCALANNHIMDWEVQGLRETLATLRKAQIQYAGAGENLDEAQTPVILELPGCRILIFSIGVPSSGIPHIWGAKVDQPGVWLLNDLSEHSLMEVKETIECYRKPGDLCIVSIHWGKNWGYQIPLAHQIFAQGLIKSAHVNLVHGHSSHHPIGLEVFEGCPIFYGCGDFINDYEGISGYEEFKGHLSLMYFLEFDVNTLKLKHLLMVPLVIKNFTLHYAQMDDCKWLIKILQKHSPHSPIQWSLNEDHKPIYIEGSVQ
ncbi:capsule biosynthesis protein [Legionella lansingensis]|uniref:Capsule biosynthesis protein n=1 Tax=Legionella lansingensis TaxID=45067 RepID=A0A0W0VLL0_9GAMM|nr:CapA family protein [Legionella lansingensis]KTD20988.1 capsule biosynthesis protein [Legionella lansingensis]SNV44792.1 capsule biosynthesis protein [Legionella lansingensis]